MLYLEDIAKLINLLLQNKNYNLGEIKKIKRLIFKLIYELEKGE